MPDRPIVIIHGWSDDSRSFRTLARLLREDLKRSVQTINLADYESMDDEVTFDDLATAMSRAWERRGLPMQSGAVDVVVHSTGGLVIRDWLQRNYTRQTAPVKHLLMLAPANFGSPLAHKGRSFIGRVIKGFKGKKLFQTGARILMGLELASPYTWNLALRDRFGDLDLYGPGAILCTVLVGNAGYTGIGAAANEEGTDGTVRASTANMNCALLDADYSRDPLKPSFVLTPSKGSAAFGVLAGENHSTITAKSGGPRNPSTRSDYGRALTVEDGEFGGWCRALEDQTRQVMDAGAKDPYTHGYQNTVFLVRDQFDAHVQDYFLEFYAKDDRRDRAAAFFHEEAIRTVHAYANDKAYRSVYIDCTTLHRDLGKDIPAVELSLTALPEFRRNGNVGYRTFTDTDIGSISIPRTQLEQVFVENRTLLVRLTLRREQAEGLFQIRGLEG